MGTDLPPANTVPKPTPTPSPAGTTQDVITAETGSQRPYHLQHKYTTPGPSPGKSAEFS